MLTVSEHSSCIQLGQPQKSDLAEHCIKLNNQPHWDGVCVLARPEKFYEQVILESLLIQLESKAVSREGGYTLKMTCLKQGYSTRALMIELCSFMSI